jgi:hypothetical protein
MIRGNVAVVRHGATAPSTQSGAVLLELSPSRMRDSGWDQLPPDVRFAGEALQKMRAPPWIAIYLNQPLTEKPSCEAGHMTAPDQESYLVACRGGWSCGRLCLGLRDVLRFHLGSPLKKISKVCNRILHIPTRCQHGIRKAYCAVLRSVAGSAHVPGRSQMQTGSASSLFLTPCDHPFAKQERLVNEGAGTVVDCFVTIALNLLCSAANSVSELKRYRAIPSRT